MNADCRLRNAEWEQKYLIPKSELYTPNQKKEGV